LDPAWSASCLGKGYPYCLMYKNSANICLSYFDFVGEDRSTVQDANIKISIFLSTYMYSCSCCTVSKCLDRKIYVQDIFFVFAEKSS